MARLMLVGAAVLVVFLLHSAASPWLKRYAVPEDACRRWATNGLTLTPPMAREIDHAFKAPAPQQPSDDMSNQRRSTGILCEDWKVIGVGHSSHDDIRQKGAGRYSHWSGTLYFSTPDNTDPNGNGRRYSLVFPPAWYRLLISQ